MNARSICAVALLFIGSAACDDDTKDTSNSDTAADGSVHSHELDKDTDKSKDSGKSDKKADSGKPTDKGSDADAGADTKPKEPADYSKAENWLCRPGHNEKCEGDLSTTIVKADGKTEKEEYKAASDPAIDCFYVYPTVSLDTTPNSDLNAGPEEDGVVHAQFARFGSQCRLFAPIYRQVTLTALRANLSGMTLDGVDRELGLNDVKAAFKYYLDHDNKGRPYVLVGHSQGSGVLTQLIKSELDKDKVDERFLTAFLAGTTLLVPKDKKVGGTFAHVPVCEKAEQLGCVVAYASFRDNSPPPDNSLFATSSDDSQEAVCVNPTNPSGASSDTHAYMSTNGPGLSSNPMGDWAKDVKVETPFVSVPGLLSAECKKGSKNGYYLSIKVNGNPDDPRTDDIVGDVVANGTVSKEWGLHLIDIPVVMGNLLDLTKTKAEAHAKK